MFFRSWYVDVFTVIIFSFAKKKKLIAHLFKRLIYEIQNNLHQLTTHMLTLIMWHYRFSENENEAVEAHTHDTEIPRPKSHGIEVPRPKNRDIEIPRLKNHDIEIPRFEIPSHDIEFPRNSDPYAP